MRPVPMPDSLPVKRFERALLSVVAAVLTCACFPAQAQMQIPNPLIRPRGIGSQPATPGSAGAAAGTAAAAGGGAGVNRAAAPSASATPSYAGAVPLPGTVLPSEDPFDRTLTELTNRFANFYVSAIVGKQAMLRRSSAPLAAGAATGAAAGNGAVALASLPGPAPAAPARSESMTLTDGELLPSVSKTGALMVKVSNSNVVITYAQETMSLPGGRLMGRRAIVFSGGVESSGATVATPIVLERMDPAYKRMITVETKTRGASSNGTTDTPNTNTQPPSGGLPPP